MREPAQSGKPPDLIDFPSESGFLEVPMMGFELIQSRSF
jgi:hypothetical protein